MIFVVAVVAAGRAAAVPQLYARWAARSAPRRKILIPPASSASMRVAPMPLPTAIAMVTVGLAGAFLGMRATFDPYAGAPQLLFAFEAAVIGGAGSLWGTLVGGIVLALAQTLGAQLHPLGFLIGGHVAFVIVLFVRLFRPGWACAACCALPARKAGMSALRPDHEGRALDAGVARAAVARRRHRRRSGACARAVPALAGAGRPLTALFIYVILAAMWNALAGFGGLVSVGQQVFFGLGAYFAIRLADAGIDPFVAMFASASSSARSPGRCRCSCCG